MGARLLDDNKLLTRCEVRTGRGDSHIMLVLGAAETRAFVTSDGATNAEAPEAHATAITADFIVAKG